jgi:hypothetical protein
MAQRQISSPLLYIQILFRKYHQSIGNFGAYSFLVSLRMFVTTSPSPNNFLDANIYYIAKFGMNSSAIHSERYLNRNVEGMTDVSDWQNQNVPKQNLVSLSISEILNRRYHI